MGSPDSEVLVRRHLKPIKPRGNLTERREGKIITIEETLNTPLFVYSDFGIAVLSPGGSSSVKPKEYFIAVKCALTRLKHFAKENEFELELPNIRSRYAGKHEKLKGYENMPGLHWTVTYSKVVTRSYHETMLRLLEGPVVFKGDHELAMLCKELQQERLPR